MFWLGCLYCAVALRVFVAQYCNNFNQATFRLVIHDAPLQCRLQRISRVMLLGSTLLWPVLLAVAPELFLRAFLLGQSRALSALGFQQGMWAARAFDKIR